MKRIFAVLLLGFLTTSFSVPEKIQKKATKEIKKFFQIETFLKEDITFSEDILTKLPSKFEDKNFFKIIYEDKLKGYAYIGNAPSKTATFDYLVIFDPDFIILKSKVLVYREEYGGEIGSKRWLRQFTDKSPQSEALEYNKNIVPISGATISVRSMTQAVNNLLKSLNYLQEKNIL